MLNSFLQFLEQDGSESIVVAATNHPKLLDRALFRRFDAVIDYVLPSRQIAEQIMHARLALLDTSRLDWSKTLDAAEGLSHADLTRACEDAAKKAILAHRTRVETFDLVGALSERRAAQD